MKSSIIGLTSDRLIRNTLRERLSHSHEGQADTKIIEEFGVAHGAARVDVAVVNGSIHGYELKSDLDTLYRLPEQMRIYNLVLDYVTLVVGKQHLREAFNIVPDWWGITIAKFSNSFEVSLCDIRESEQNPKQDKVAIAKLLWREEALEALEKANEATGIRSKSRQIIYEKLAEVLDEHTLKKTVRSYLCSRRHWRVEI
ncbi:MAG: sce7726 family protein [Patescibacteria group bacterium]